jgi:type IV secretory pathway VirB4 component
MLNSNYADVSFLFTIDQGRKRNEHLNSEYLAVLETDHATPYYLNLHEQDVAHTLILGYTGSGKSFLLNFLIQNLQKYEPLTYIFEGVGGSNPLSPTNLIYNHILAAIRIGVSPANVTRGSVVLKRVPFES